MKRILTVLLLLLITITAKSPIKDQALLKRERLNLYVSFMEEKIGVYREEQLRMFLHSLGFSESSSNAQIWNEFGYLGKYQFGKAARKDVGYSHITFNNFRKDPSIWPEEQQEEAMIRWLQLNEMKLKDIIVSYDRVVFKGNAITKSGILAAAHLAGPKGVRVYFESRGEVNPKDAYGTSLEDYLIKFSGYFF